MAAIKKERWELRGKARERDRERCRVEGERLRDDRGATYYVDRACRVTSHDAATIVYATF